MDRPDFYDPWEFVKWMRGKDRELFVRIEVQNKQNQKVMTLLPLDVLDPTSWVFWTKRLFFDRMAAVRTVDEWRAWEKEHEQPPAYLDDWHE